MCRLVGWIGAQSRTLLDVLGADALARFTDLSRVHGHGWGIVSRAENGELRSHRSTKAAHADPEFATVAANWSAASALVHLRWATPGFGLSLQDTHPFLADDWAMVHNGAISPSSAVGALLKPESARTPLGSTDSERFFLAVRDEIGADEPTVASFGAAIETVSERGVAAGLRASSLNSMFLSPAGLFVLNWHDPAQVPPIDSDAPNTPPYYDLRHRFDDGTHVVVSSGFVDHADTFDLLPQASTLHLRGDGSVADGVVRPVAALCPVLGADAA